MDTETIYNNWASTGLLSGIDDQNIAKQVAILMENQRRINGNQDKWTPPFLRTSIPVIRRVFGSFIPNEIISVQTMIAPASLYYWIDKWGNVKSGEIASRTRNYKTYSIEEYLKDKTIQENSLDAEADCCVSISNDLRDEITREILNDLRHHAGVKLAHQWKNREIFLDYLKISSSLIGRKVGKSANWIVISWDLAQELQEVIDVTYDSDKINPEQNVFLFGILDKMKVFVDGECPSEKILIGYRGSKLEDAGYFYCPYVLLSEVETENGWRLYSRHGKKLVNPEYYAIAELSGYSKSG